MEEMDSVRPSGQTSGLSSGLTTREVIDRVFKDPKVAHSLKEFKNLGVPIDSAISTYEETRFRADGVKEIRYFLNCLKRGIPLQVLSEKRGSPEEIVRQLWLYKLHGIYRYPWDRIQVEKRVMFGGTEGDKPADIVVYQSDLVTPKIVVETKRPNRTDGINQLKSYLNAEGSPVGVWSNGQDPVILYRSYPHEFDDTLTEVPDVDQEPKDVLTETLRIGDLRREFDFKDIVKDLEELVLANSGYDEFNEIFKLIFSKLYDERSSMDDGARILRFRKSEDPDITYRNIDALFRKAIEEWPGIFDEREQIKLSPQHLQIVIGPMERIQLMGANMRVMDDAFEYLMPPVAKKKNGQFFTPRYVIDMCIRMLNPTRKEYVLDPACGSAGFLLHVMDYVWPAPDDTAKERRKHKYATKRLWGIDFDERSAKVARALMLIAGDGKTHVFRANALDPTEWFLTPEGEALRSALMTENLLWRRPTGTGVVKESEAWDFYQALKFDVVLTNPPFAGEIRDAKLLSHYDLAKRALARKDKKGAKEERDVLFIERCVAALKPGGRCAIVLPQGKFNNPSLRFIRDWILDQARLLAVVGLHPNTFKPHTGTKTSVLFLQKHTEDERKKIGEARQAVSNAVPDFTKELDALLETPSLGDADILARLSLELEDIRVELFEAEIEEDAGDEDNRESGRAAEPHRNHGDDGPGEDDDSRITSLQSQLSDLRNALEDNDLTRREAKARRRELAALEERYKALRTSILGSTIRGQLQLISEDVDMLAIARQRWIAKEIAKSYKYQVFSAISELGGKDNSGNYVFRRVDGRLVLDDFGSAMILQDCTRYSPDEPAGIAERFSEWARGQNLSFAGE